MSNKSRKRLRRDNIGLGFSLGLGSIATKGSATLPSGALVQYNSQTILQYDGQNILQSV